MRIPRLFHLPMALLLLALPVRASDVVLSVDATGPSGRTLTYAWSRLAMPLGSVAPSGLPTSPTTVNHASVSFAANALPGMYVFQVQVRDGISPVATSTTSVHLTRGQTITFPASGTNLVYAEDMADIDPGATSSVPGLPITYRCLSGPASIAGNRLHVTGVGTIVLEADVATQSPVLYRSNPKQRSYVVTAEVGRDPSASPGTEVSSDAAGGGGCGAGSVIGLLMGLAFMRRHGSRS
jgi:hypothetical protein